MMGRADAYECLMHRPADANGGLLECSPITSHFYLIISPDKLNAVVLLGIYVPTVD